MFFCGLFSLRNANYFGQMQISVLICFVFGSTTNDLIA